MYIYVYIFFILVFITVDVMSYDFINLINVDVDVDEIRQERQVGLVTDVLEFQSVNHVTLILFSMSYNSLQTLQR